MILVDTCVWSHHFRRGSPKLVELLDNARVMTHPWIVGELALGPGLRHAVIDDLRQLPSLTPTTDEALLDFVLLHCLRGIGWVDAQLVASALTAKTPIWTSENRLHEIAERFGVAFDSGDEDTGQLESNKIE